MAVEVFEPTWPLPLHCAQSRQELNGSISRRPGNSDALGARVPSCHFSPASLLQGPKAMTPPTPVPQSYPESFSCLSLNDHA